MLEQICPCRSFSFCDSIQKNHRILAVVISHRSILCYTYINNNNLLFCTHITIVGASGSGKTTFLNDVHTQHKCIYIRQYHNLRPYIRVSAIPNFDATKLPYWDIYERESKTKVIKVGGTMAGEFTAGLSGGQRKLLLFELIYQRTLSQSNLLICLDEPFAGVTDDFVPFIVQRLNEMRKNHNILLVTNDHVKILREMADNVITVSALDRNAVMINSVENMDRHLALMAMSVGQKYKPSASNADLNFFFDVEVRGSAEIMGVVGFTAFSMALFLLSYWDSKPESAALVVFANQIISYFCIKPYLLALVDWRIYVLEEAEALMHSSPRMNSTLKTCLCFSILMAISLSAYGCLNAVIDGFGTFDYFVAMLFDSGSMTFPLVCLGLYSTLSFQAVQIFGTLPFLFMIFFSTTFSPGAGVEAVKELRYLFSRFYFWCFLPGVEDSMEGCPETESENLLYLVLSGLCGVALFLVVKVGYAIHMNFKKAASKEETQNIRSNNVEFHKLQKELYGDQKFGSLDASNEKVSGEDEDKA